MSKQVIVYNNQIQGNNGSALLLQNLTPENIKKDVVIGGKTGTFEGEETIKYVSFVGNSKQRITIENVKQQPIRAMCATSNTVTTASALVFFNVDLTNNSGPVYFYNASQSLIKGTAGSYFSATYDNENKTLEIYLPNVPTGFKNTFTYYLVLIY